MNWLRIPAFLVTRVRNANHVHKFSRLSRTSFVTLQSGLLTRKNNKRQRKDDEEEDAMQEEDGREKVDKEGEEEAEDRLIQINFELAW